MHWRRWLLVLFFLVALKAPDHTPTAWAQDGADTVEAQSSDTRLDAGLVYLPAVYEGTGAPLSQTSVELIDEAVAKGELAAETALVYKVFASFGDSRLPNAYRGTGNTLDAILLREVAAKYDQLSPASHTLLAPFFQPPIYRDSWYATTAAQTATHAGGGELRASEDGECSADPGPAPITPGGWGCIDSGAGANFRVWWQLQLPGQKERAEYIVQHMQNEIWPKLVILMHRDPPSDKGPHRFVGPGAEEQVWGDGGDGRLDIYLIVPPPNTGGAATVAYPPGCDSRPSFVLVDPEMDEDLMLAALTHEFFHTFQFAADVAKQCDEWTWWSEATANWAIDFVYPENNWEHIWAFRYLQQSGWSRTLNRDVYGGRSAYLFPQFVTKFLNDTGFIRRSWESATASPGNSLAAIESAAGVSLTDLWHEFAAATPNEPPWDVFRSWDAMTYPVKGDYVNYPKSMLEIVGTAENGDDVAKGYDPVELEGGPDTTFEMPTGIPPLAMLVYRYRFLDSNARSVAFTNPLFFAPQPDARILAFYKVAGGEWQREDWTETFAKTFCRDSADQNVEELILIISNGQWRDRGKKLELSPDPLLAVTNIGCWRWEGTFETEIHVTAPGTDYTEHYTGRLVFEPLADAPDGLVANPIYQHYEVVDGSVTWTQAGTLGGCQVDGGPETYSSANSFEGNLETSSFSANREWDYRIHTGVVSLLPTGTVHTRCPDHSFSSDLSHAVIATFGQGSKPISGDGLTLQGRHAETSGGVSAVTTWRLTAKTGQ